MTAVKAD